MSARRFSPAGPIAIVILPTLALGAQAPPPAATNTVQTKPSSVVPRTVDGQPDLQGVWSFATLTPVERPDRLAQTNALTWAEAAEFEAQTARTTNRDFNVPAGNVGDWLEGVAARVAGAIRSWTA